MIFLIASFQQKLLLPTLCFAVGTGVAGYFMIYSTPIILGIGYGYIVGGPVAHYLIYELRHKNEYYFYFNAGLSKTLLYISTVIFNLILGGIILCYA